MTGVLLTGATGLLGRFVLRQLLQAGREVTVLARRTDEISANSRVDEAIRPFEEQLGRTLPRPAVVEGQLHEPGLGLSAADRQWVARHCISVAHCAASVTFEQDPADNEPYRSNVAGTERLLEFCEESGIRQFHHVSTAYVCGDRPGLILEDELDRGQRFRNDYERTKFAAEQLLRTTTWLDSLTVYRPSIIVGDSTTAYSSTFHGFYLPLQLAHWATCAGVFADRSGYMAALGLRGDERKNLVPVDWVAEMLVHVFDHARWHNQTYHLTNPVPTTTAEMDEAIAAAIADTTAARPVLPSHSTAGSNLDAFRQRMQVYAGYLSDDPEFDRRHTRLAVAGRDCPRLEPETLARLARFAIRAGFGWPRPPHRPAVLDVHALMRRLPQLRQPPRDAGTLRLVVSGSFGGAWQVWFQGADVVGVQQGPVDQCDFSGYLNVHTLGDLLAGRQTVRGALSSARLVLAGERDQLSRGPDRIENLCRCLIQP